GVELRQTALFAWHDCCRGDTRIVDPHSYRKSCFGLSGIVMSFPCQPREDHGNLRRDLNGRVVAYGRLLTGKIGIQITRQHTMKGVLEEAYLIVGMDQGADLGTERLMLCRRHFPQRRQRQVDDRKPGGVAQLTDRISEALCQLENAWVGLGLQAG